MDQIRALEVFVAVAETGNFASAGRKLSISAPSITRVIAELEESLGAILFHRTTRIVSLTDVGQNYLVDAKKILSTLQTANDAARGAHSAPKGLLTVTASMLFGQHYISPIILEYLDKYPDVNVELLLLDRVTNLIEEGIDIAVRIGHLQDSNMIATKVGEVFWSICGSPSYFERYGIPQTPNALKDHQVIAVGSMPSKLEWEFANQEIVSLKPRVAYSSVATGISASETGWGLMRVLSYQIGPQLESGKLQTVLSEYLPENLPIHIIHSEGSRASAKVRTFIDLVVCRLRQNSALK